MSEFLTETHIMPRDSKLTADPILVGQTTGLPVDVLRAAATRLRVLAIMYSATFALANFSAPIIANEHEFFTRPIAWVPGVVSIAVGLFVFWFAGTGRVSATRLIDIGLAFGVVGSYGIACSEHLPALMSGNASWSGLRFIGLSWVAPWMVSFTVVIPSPPRKALLSAIGSGTAVPVVLAVGLVLTGGSTTFGLFFFAAIFPYVLVVCLAWVCARVVYGLGRAIGRAREMGSYQLIEQLGQGGMGEVWTARHRMLARPAAIKLVRREVLTQGGGDAPEVTLRRFEREAQATALLESPHTIQLFDYGVASDGTFYYVMELLDGFDLDTLVQQFGPLSASRTVHYLDQVCHSLGEAHAGHLIHRDIKPANIFTCRFGREVDFIKVLDFGLVKSQSGAASTPDAAKLTAADVTGGTPAFMSPEQILGRGELDARSDIYALGCVAYWLLTGQLVFEGQTAMQVVAKHAHDIPVPPSERTEVEIPADLERLILECLEKDPDDRPQTVDELADRLRAATPIAWSLDAALRWWSTHRPASTSPSERVRTE